MLVRDPETGALVRVCPHCGAGNPALGTLCLACGQRIDAVGEAGEASFVDELPLIDPDGLPGGAAGLAGVVLAGIANAVIVVVATPAVLLRRAVRAAMRRGR